MLSVSSCFMAWLISTIKHFLMFLMPIAMPHIQRKAAQALSNTASNLLGTKYSNQHRSLLFFLPREDIVVIWPCHRTKYDIHFTMLKHANATNVGILKKDRSWWALTLPLPQLPPKPNLWDALGQQIQVFETISLSSSPLVPIILYWKMKSA